MTLLKPMRGTAVDSDLEKLRYPLLASAKLDGIRCLIVDPAWYRAYIPYQPKHITYIRQAKHALAVSRTLKPIPNRHVQSELDKPEFIGLDGELIVGSPVAKNVYRETNSAVMSHCGFPAFKLFYFDDWRPTTLDFEERHYRLSHLPDTEVTTQLTHSTCTNYKELESIEEGFINAGFEGAILRDPDALYKYGKSTLKEGGMLKLKRFKDSEAQIVGFEERMHNANDAILDELGYTKRSSHQENKIPTGTLGAFIVKDIHNPSIPEFKIGTGFTAQQALTFWMYRSEYLKKIVKYKHLPYGIKDKPRHPVFLGFRHLEDIV